MSRGCAAALLVVGLMTGCGGSTTKSDGGTSTTTTPTPICTPNQATCVNDTTATICTANGLALVPVQCGAGSTCTNGACTAVPNATCTSADDTCTDTTHAVVCGASGPTSVTCPADTACQAGGICAGACVVGSSYCSDIDTLVTCADGNTQTSTTCGTGMNCVTTNDSPVATAACKPSTCTPDPYGCDSVCGDKTGGTGTATNTVSTCAQTPTGYQWIAIGCTGANTCSPSGTSCANGATAACTSQCNPGDTRCEGTLGIQTCRTDGTWDTTMQCNASTAAITSTCFIDQAGAAVCGDAACVDSVTNGDTFYEVGAGQGVCDATGAFRLCGIDGKVSATATACPAGDCVSVEAPIGAYAQGACTATCTTGEQRCIGEVSYEVCANGVYGAALPCGAGTSCLAYVAQSGLPSTLCGVCLPGASRCSGDTSVQTCGNDGTWGAVQACAVGTCKSSGATTAACIADCFPNTTMCYGPFNGSTDIGIPVQTAVATCSATGTLPTSGTACGTGTTCRTSASGVSYGCVTCVGTQNEFGLPDTRCYDGSDTNDDNYAESCLPDNSGWDSADAVACTGNFPRCRPPSTDIPKPTQSLVCATILVNGLGNIEARASVLALGGYTCEMASTFGDLGPPAPCGTTPDCCSFECVSPPAPTPAFCDAN